MFIMNNLHGRKHHKIYKTGEGQSRPIFDISEKQIANVTNADWNELKTGDYVCVVLESHKMSTIFVVDSIQEEEGTEGVQHVVRGTIVAKFEPEREYINTLNKYHVKHARLKNNKFPIGFNVANLGDQLNDAEIKSKTATTFGELKNN